jgi:hypothetical protein
MDGSIGPPCLLLQRLREYYTLSWISHLWHAASHADLFFNVSGIHTSMSQADLNASIDSILQAPEGFLRNLSAYIDLLDSDSDPKRGLMRSVLDGAAGVVTKPVQGWRKGGMRGAIGGMGKGPIGVVAKPVSGLAEAGADLLGATGGL